MKFRSFTPMPLASRALPIVLALLFALQSVRAQRGELPPIFAPRSNPAPESSHSVPVKSPISDRVRGLIAQRVLAEAPVFVAPPTPATVDTVAEMTAGSMVLMDKFVVRSSSLRLLDLPRPQPPLVNFLKHGLLYHHMGKKG